MTTWHGSTKCDFCKEDLSKNLVGSRLYDAKTIHGPWATMCSTCWIESTHQQLGVGLGKDTSNILTESLER